MASVGPAATRPRGRRLADLARLQGLRLQVFIRRVQLDEQLASGLDPASRPALTLRAAQLLRPRYRRRLARSVERLIDDVDAERYLWLSPAVPFLHDQVAEARVTLLSLAHALRAADLIRPRGAAMVLMLLEDPASPLYTGVARGALQLQAQTALDCLLGQRQSRPEAWAAAPSSTRGGSGGVP